MSYVALYRKFRPDSFDEVKGQEHIVTTLRNQVKYNRVGHAYLFSGTRGTGKTTMAKLLAKVVNCENVQDGNPCCECESCRAIASGNAMNVIEIDAASNSGVDNIRQLKETVQYAPASGKKLVYIIDEAHMLTREAFNALLKTLEEPPEYCLFVLATTEDHKIPVTIKSRCQKYDFHRISVETISARLGDLVAREGVDAEEDALSFIARAADGSMRDALSILDECISSGSRTLTYENVLKIIGAVDIEVYIRLTNALNGNNAREVLDLVNDAVWQGKDLIKYVDDYVWFMRNLLFIKLSPDSTSGMDLSGENVEALKSLGGSFSEETLARYLSILQDLSQSVRLSSIKRVTIEMAFIKLMHPETDSDYNAVISRLEKLEKDGQQTPAASDEAFSAAVEAAIEAHLEAKLDEKLRAVAAVNTYAVQGQPSGKQEDTPLGEEEISENVKKLLKEKYKPAEYEEIIRFAEQWQNQILPKLSMVAQRYLKNAGVEPGKEMSPEGEVSVLNIYIPVIDAEGGNSMEYIYFFGDDNKSNSQHMRDVEEEVSALTKRAVTINFQKRNTATNDAVTPEDVFINRIRFDGVKIKEEE